MLEVSGNQGIDDAGCEKLLDCLNKVKTLGLVACNISPAMKTKLKKQANIHGCNVLV